MTKSIKSIICVSVFFAFLHMLMHTLGLNCGLANRVRGESQYNCSRLELYLLSFGKVKMLTQYPQIARGGCLGLRR